MKAEDNTIFATYYDHYKDTISESKKAQARRNRNFVCLCVLEAISGMMIYNPNLICGLLNDAASKELETTIHVSNSIVQTLVWVIIAYVLVRYVQNVLYIERQYRYIDDLEKKLSEWMGEKKEYNQFCRESEHYISDYPIVLNLIDLFYKMFCPILFTIINIVHIVSEYQKGESGISIVCDTAVCAVICIITWFYFFEIHSKISAWAMKCPPISGIGNMLKKLLKEV